MKRTLENCCLIKKYGAPRQYDHQRPRKRTGGRAAAERGMRGEGATKRYYIIAAIIAAANLAVYPITRHIAYMERGYSAHGGEDMILIFGFFAAVWLILRGREKTRLDHGETCDCRVKKDELPESSPSFTESEQSSINHLDAKLLYHRHRTTVNQYQKGERT